jgi:uncharacterized protein (TIRG00374 family)
MVPVSDEMKNKLPGRKLLFVVKCGLSATLLFAAVWLLDWDALLQSLSKIGPVALALTVVVLLLEFPILGYRWHLMVRDHNHLGLAVQLRIYFIAIFFNNFTPGQLGSDIYRFTHHKKTGASGKVLAALLIRERLIGLAGFLLFFLICYASEGFGENIPKGPGADLIQGAAILCVVSLIGLAALPFLAPFLTSLSKKMSPPWIKLLAEVAVTTTNIGSLRQIAVIIILTVLGAGVIWCGAVKIVAMDLGSNASFFMLGMTAVLADLLRLVPVTIQGVGVREAVFAGLFGAFGLPPEEGFVIGLVAYVCVSLATVTIGIIGKLMPKRKLQL